MKIERWHFDKDYSSEEEKPLPVLDWSWYYIDRHFDYRWAGVGQIGFTGKYYKIFSFSFVIFRHEFGFRVEYGYGEMTPEQAFRAYHDRIKERRK